jgi:dTDP-4-dehydrorhamnose reductase
VSHIRTWARAAKDAASRFTLISSDAVFTGPWMFHPETSRGLCDSQPARTVREAEAAVLEAHASALIVRTHVFGWTPEICGAGWIERELARLEAGAAGSHDPFRHATPLLATDFAEVLQQAWRESLSGLYHVAGAERTNPARFAQRLAQEFALPAPAASHPETLLDCPRGFGCGETSLRTGAIRRALGISLPSLGDGLRRLREQAENGWRDRLNGSTMPRRQQAA